MTKTIEAMIAQITRLYEEDQKSSRKAVSASDIPISYEAITPEWLTNVLCTAVPGAKVLSHRLDAPDDGSSNRRRIFIEYNETGSSAGLPATVFCKSSFDLLNRVMLGVSDCARTEISFYNNVRPLMDIEAVNRRANGTPYRRAKGTPFHDGARLIGHAPLRCARRREGGARPEARAAQSIF